MTPLGKEQEQHTLPLCLAHLRLTSWLLEPAAHAGRSTTCARSRSVRTALWRSPVQRSCGDTTWRGTRHACPGVCGGVCVGGGSVGACQGWWMGFVSQWGARQGWWVGGVSGSCQGGWVFSVTGACVCGDGVGGTISAVVWVLAGGTVARATRSASCLLGRGAFRVQCLCWWCKWPLGLHSLHCQL